MRFLVVVPTVLLLGCTSGESCEETTCAGTVAARCAETADCTIDDKPVTNADQALSPSQSLRVHVSLPFTTYRTIRVSMRALTAEGAAAGGQTVAITVDGVHGTHEKLWVGTTGSTTRSSPARTRSSKSASSARALPPEPSPSTSSTIPSRARSVASDSTRDVFVTRSRVAPAPRGSAR